MQTAIKFLSPDFGSSCHSVTSVLDPTIVLDGECERFLLRGSSPVIAVSPNPVSISATPPAILHIEVREDAVASLCIITPVGLRIPVEPARAWRKGKHDIPVDLTRLPAGTYIAVWMSPGTIVSRPFLVLQ